MAVTTNSLVEIVNSLYKNDKQNAIKQIKELEKKYYKVVSELFTKDSYHKKGNEVKKAVDLKFPADKIVFSGVGKSDDEINLALQNRIFCFNCESIPEIEVINELAGKLSVIANIALRINPNVKANTHQYITTRLEENKFGINIWEMEEVLSLLNRCCNLKLI